MSTVVAETDNPLFAALATVVGADNLLLDMEQRKLYSCDVYSEGKLCAAVIRPTSAEHVSAAAKLITEHGYSIAPRGGGMSYTSGYIPINDTTIVVDTGAMNKILEISETNMYVTVQAGVTWAQLYEALKPKGLRLPFFGTFSGIRATVGGGMSNGALFFGTARYGTGVDNLLGLEVVLADGSRVCTGQAAVHNGKPFYRTYGPDLTGLFTHDCGALGIKTEATLRLIQWPAEAAYLSFVFKGAQEVAKGLSAVTRSGAAEEAYVFDPGSTAKNLANSNIASDLKTLASVIRGQSSLGKGLKAGAKLVAAGRSFIDEDLFSLHIVCAGRSEAAVRDDVEIIRKLCEELDGAEIPNSIPMAARADPFQPLNGVLGPDGDRWAALNSKVAHSDAAEIIERFDKIMAKYETRMQETGVFMTRLMIGIDTHAFSFEPVFHWFDSWLPLHKHVAEPSHLKKFTNPDANPAAGALVEEMRIETVQLFKDMGAASNQIGRTYPYLDSMKPESAKLLRSIKDIVDAKGLVNPGALGF
jgi:D-lactate dehydrogenase (cytochrome)